YLDGRAIRVGERRRERLAQLQGLGKQDAWREALRSPRLERRKDALLQLGTQAAHRAQPLRLSRLAQRLGRVDAQLVVQLARALGPQAGEAHDRDQARRKLGAQLLRGGDRAAVEQRADLLWHRGA